MRPLRRPTLRCAAVVPFSWLTIAILSLTIRALPAATDQPRPSWDAEEYARMARPEKPGEAAATAEKPFNPEDYRVPKTLPTATPKTPPEEESAFREFAKSGKLYIRSAKYFDFDPDTQRFYSRERSTLRYGDYNLTADKVLIDIRLQEAEAEGNVELRWKDSTITADKMHFNFERQEGEAYHVAGQYGPLYFVGPKNEEPGNPGFRKDNHQIDRLRDISLTTCDFPIPHYRIRAKEMIVSERDRVYLRNAILYIWNVPVMYLPAYSRSLVEKSPWSFIVGYDSKLGGALRVTYDYYYKDYVPSETDKKSLTRRTFVQITGIGDVLTKRGVGGGVSAAYTTRSGKDEGSLDLYTIGDHGVDVKTADGENEENSADRSWIHWLHRSDITPELQFMTNVDWPSDSEIHEDILDFFDKDQTRRVPERNATAALTWNDQNFIARILGGVKDRIGRDRVNNFANNTDDDTDFDANFDSRGRFVPGVNGSANFSEDVPELPRSRWSRVSERAPQITLATPWLKPSCSPLYYQADLNILNNLDKGLNVLDTGDDSFVRGFDFYQALMYALQFGDSSSLITKAGAGFGQIKREDNSLHYDFSKATVLPDGNRQLGGLIFTNDHTFLVGDKKFSLRDYDPDFAYGDFETKWSTRITDALSGYVRYFVRQNTGEPLGQFYEQIGDRLARSDLYDSRLNKNEVTGGLDYRLAHPDLALSLNAGQNLRPDGELAPNENIHTVGANARYSSPDGVLVSNIGTRYDELERDLPYNQTDVNPKTVTIYGDIEDHPVGKPYWAGIRGDVIKYLSGVSDFTQQNVDYTVTGLVGAPIGLKWDGEVQVTYDGQFSDIDRIRLLLKRDLHDVVAALIFTARRHTVTETVADIPTESRQWDRLSVQMQVSLKFLNQEAPLSTLPVVTLREKAKNLQTEQ